MQYTLTAAWTVTGRNPLELSSETSTLRISLPSEAEHSVVRLLGGWAEGAQLPLEPLRKHLVQRGVIRMEATSPTPDQVRQIEYWRAFTDSPQRVVETLRASQVAIAGCGGAGSVALEHLVGGGIRRFRLLDCDVVEPSNMNRQFIYDAASVGRFKVEEARRYVVNRVADAAVATSTEAWNATSKGPGEFLLEGADVVVAAIDKPSIASSLQVLDAAWERGVAAILMAVGLQKSLVSQVFMPGTSVRSPREALEYDGTRTRTVPFLASFGPSNSQAAIVAADQILHHLAGMQQRVDYNRPLILMRAPDGAPTGVRVERARV